MDSLHYGQSALWTVCTAMLLCVSRCKLRTCTNSAGHRWVSAALVRPFSPTLTCPHTTLVFSKITNDCDSCHKQLKFYDSLRRVAHTWVQASSTDATTAATEGWDSESWLTSTAMMHSRSPRSGSGRHIALR